MTSVTGNTDNDVPKQGIGAHKPSPSVSGIAHEVPVLVISGGLGSCASAPDGFSRWLAEGLR